MPRDAMSGERAKHEVPAARFEIRANTRSTAQKTPLPTSSTASPGDATRKQLSSAARRSDEALIDVQRSHQSGTTTS